MRPVIVTDMPLEDPSYPTKSQKWRRRVEPKHRADKDVAHCQDLAQHMFNLPGCGLAVFHKLAVPCYVQRFKSAHQALQPGTL